LLVCSSRGSRTQARAVQWPWAWFEGAVLQLGTGADAWARWLGAARYTKGAAPARRAPVLGVCIAAQLEPPFHTVFRSGCPGDMGVCVRL
jgi:hypothetical protein